MLRKIFINIIAILFVVTPLSTVGLAETNVTKYDKNTTDQFSQNQDGKQADLNDNKTIPENVKNRIRELADTKPETKGGTVLPKVVRPSVNHQK